MSEEKDVDDKTNTRMVEFLVIKDIDSGEVLLTKRDHNKKDDDER
jgi:hypothetical protein